MLRLLCLWKLAEAIVPLETLHFALLSLNNRKYSFGFSEQEVT